MNNTIAWMMSGGRRFDGAWEERSRQRAALAEARRPRTARAARLFARVAKPARKAQPARVAQGPTVPACCPA